MADWKEMYLIMMRASEKALKLTEEAQQLIEKAQQQCEEMYLSAEEPQLILLPTAEERELSRETQSKNAQRH